MELQGTRTTAFGSYDKKASGTEAGTFRPDDFQIALVSEIIF